MSTGAASHLLCSVAHMPSEFHTLLDQLIPPEEPDASKGRSRKGLASKRKQAQRRNLMREFESEIDKWLSSVAAAVTVEAGKSLIQAANLDETGFGLSLGKGVAKDAAIRKAAESLGAFASHQAISQLLSHPGIFSLLAGISRKHRNTKASQGKRPGAKALYKKKIEELLRRDIDMDCQAVLSGLEGQEWIIRASNDIWMVAAAEIEGRPDDSVPFKEIRNATLEEAISTIRNNLKKCRTNGFS